MYPVSDAFRSAVVASNQLAVSQACVVAGDDVLGWLDIVAGAVDCDGTRSGPLRSLSLTVAPNPDAFDWLVTAGAEVRVWRGLTLDGAASRATYVAAPNYAANNVTIIDAATNLVVATVAVDAGPRGAIISPDGRRCYVGSQTAATISVIDLTTFTVIGTITSNVYAPSAMAITPDGTQLWEVPSGGGFVNVFSTQTNALIGTVSGMSAVHAIVISPNGATAYVTGNSYTYTVAVATRTVTATLAVVGGISTALTPDGRYLYVPAQDTSVIDTTTNTVVATIPRYSSGSDTAAMAPDGKHVWLGPYYQANAFCVDTATNAIVATVPLPSTADKGGLTLTPDGTRVYVSTNTQVVCIDATTHTVIGTIAGGAAAYYLDSAPAPQAQYTQTTELVPLGVFVLDSDLEENESGQITVGGSDRAQRISRARWVDPHTVPAGTNVATAVSDVLATCWPGCPIGASFAAVTKVTGAAQTYLDGSDSDPWNDARNLAASAGYDLFFDAEGTAQLRESPDPATAMPCFSYGSGDQAVVLTNLRTALITQMYNGAIATAEGSGVGTPKRGEAWDDDPTSPTYRYGAMGQVPTFYSSPLLTTQDDVDSAAATILARVKGRLEQRTLTIIVNPALEAFDAIELTAADGTVARYFIDSLTTPLEGATAMALTTRATPIT